MSLTDPRQRALALIERRLFQPLTLGELAAESGLSPFHLCRLFTAVLGEGPMAYVRRRRLVGAAARLLAQHEIRLVDLAFDCGFESQQAFTRAFTRLFGVSPGRFRQGRGPLQTPGDPVMTTSVDVALRPGLQHRPAFRAAGLHGRFDSSTRGAIPTLWDRFVPRLPLPGQAGNDTYGLCWSGDLDKGFEYMAAVALDPGAAVPEGIDVKDVPAQAYAVFRLTLSGEELHPQMAAAMNRIWGGWLQEAGLKPRGGPDFEFYPAGFDARRKGGWVEMWIPVEG